MLAIHTFHCGYYQLKLLCNNLQLLWCTCGKWLITSPRRVLSTFWTVQNLKLKQHYADMTSFVVFKIAHNIFIYINQSWNPCCGLNTHHSESISNKLITHFSSWTSLFMNFFQFVLLDKFKYSFSKLRKQPFHVIALVNCNALYETNMSAIRGQHHGNHWVLCQCFQWYCCNGKPMKTDFFHDSNDINRR